ncbi:nwd2 [Moniliophthora roreri]|nr:nwd2 [Moniliophthora roreri]
MKEAQPGRLTKSRVADDAGASNTDEDKPPANAVRQSRVVKQGVFSEKLVRIIQLLSFPDQKRL